MIDNRRSGIWAALSLVCALLLAACGETGSLQPGGSQGDTVNETTVPGGLDAPVSGAPGDQAAPGAGSGARGTVTDSAGAPVAGVLVTPQSTDTPPQAVPEVAVMTDDQGRYQWSLAPGAYTLTFTAEGYAPATEAVVVGPAVPVTLDVTLRKQ